MECISLHGGNKLPPEERCNYLGFDTEIALNRLWSLDYWSRVCAWKICPLQSKQNIAAYFTTEPGPCHTP